MLRQVPQYFTPAYFRISLQYNWKKAIVYAALFIVPALALSGGAVLAAKFNFFSWPVVVVEMLAFMVGGLLNIYLLQHGAKFFRPAFFMEGMWYTVLLTVVMCIVLEAFYLIVHAPMQEMAVLSGIFFLLPSVVLQSWLNWHSISSREYQVWYNPDQPALHLVAASNTRQPVKLRLVHRRQDTAFTTTNLQVPAKLKLGRVFHHFVAERNAMTTAIDCHDQQLQPAGWVFYEEMFGGLFRRHLDPLLSLQENNVKANATITAERVHLFTPSVSRSFSGTVQTGTSPVVKAVQ
jgi:hypothetical protein